MQHAREEGKLLLPLPPLAFLCVDMRRAICVHATRNAALDSLQAEAACVYVWREILGYEDEFAYVCCRGFLMWGIPRVFLIGGFQFVWNEFFSWILRLIKVIYCCSLFLYVENFLIK